MEKNAINAKTSAIDSRKKLDSDGKYAKAKDIKVGRSSRLEKITSVAPGLDLTVAFKDYLFHQILDLTVAFKNHLCYPILGLTADNFYDVHLGKMPPTTNAKTPAIDSRKKLDSDGKYVKAKDIRVGQSSRLK
jgi:hypothetical protein